jgi:hypothetical protein
MSPGEVTQEQCLAPVHHGSSLAHAPLSAQGPVLQQFGHGEGLELLPPARACEISNVGFLGGTHSSRPWIAAARVEWLATIGP